ncbi:MAG: glycosyltransferase [Actinomycetota bacterium]
MAERGVTTGDPSYSFVLPLWNSKPGLLGEQLDAIAAQAGRWECIAVDDGSTDTAGIELVEQRAAIDQRLRPIRRSTNGGIAAATNDAIEAATLDWIVFCDHDDRVHPTALERLSERIKAVPEVDLIYTDEQVIDAAGDVVEPYRKPDWSPERLLGQNYLNHLVAIRRALVTRVGGLDSAFAPCPDREFTLRATAAARQIEHIPEILYDWRSILGSVAHDVGEKPGVAAAVVAAAQRHAPNEHIAVSSVPEDAASARIEWPVPSPVPTIADVALEPTTTPADIELALRTTDADLVRLMPTNAGEMSAASVNALIAQATRDEVVAVGPRVVTADSRIVSVGRALRPHLRDLHRGWDADYLGRWGEYEVSREVAALHPAGVVLDRRAVLELGGFDGVELITRHELGTSATNAAAVALSLPVGIDFTLVLLGAAAAQTGRWLMWTPLAEVSLPTGSFHLDADIEAIIAAQGAIERTVALDDRYSPQGVQAAGAAPTPIHQSPPRSRLQRRFDVTKSAIVEQLDLPRIADRADRAADAASDLGGSIQRIWQRIAQIANVVERNHEPRLVDQEMLARIDAATAWAEHAPLRSTPLITVVLPTRNRRELVSAAIASIAAQRYDNWQLIVVDDGSTDGTADLLSALDDERIELVRTEGAGASAARNAGLAAASGEWIAFLDDDNVMHPIWLRAIAEHVGRHPDASGIFGATLRADRPHDHRPYVQFTETIDVRRLEVDNSIDLGAVAVRRGHPELHFDESLERFIDWDLIVRLARSDALAVVPVLAGVYTTDAPDRISAGGVDGPLAAMRARFRDHRA